MKESVTAFSGMGALGETQGAEYVLREAYRALAPGRVLDPKEGYLSRDAAKYGVELRTRSEWIKAVRNTCDARDY